MSVLPLARHRAPLATLEDLRPGQRGVIATITAEGEIGERLLEMGLTPGTTVEIVGRGPFGDPLQVRLRGSLLAMRRAQALAVRVEPIPPPARAGAG